MQPYKGKLIVLEGLDGIGKGTQVSALTDLFESEGKKVFDIHNFWTQYHFHPQFDSSLKKYYKDINSFDVLILAEPTYVGAGRSIREEAICENDRRYSALSTAQLYAIDRLVLDKRVTLPALNAGKIVIKSRSVVSSLVYQPVQAQEKGEKLTIEDVLALEGNTFAMRHSPNLLVIGTIKNPDELIKRLAEREKKDDAIFENINFQLKIKPHYESKWLKDLFEKEGTKVEYLDAGISVESTKEQVVRIVGGR
jgi:dTMP kinase